ncbi:TVP38/TMEM64 family protein [Clostridium grantii]|uniref:TVP38/TMEM64 family membrane protein n=1 Tax=Clostridium grantii DSM 8605 TaxID=1121316 RepID=A0A1M5XF34_9CLOT|nr:TVP38/TMEM64 family protein [Clostridium grantii]SHH98396.1 Uncharacterized membrane protein YdjX, TVP38/TMEM64 family, SNARE-associated domain [Clostridium grantii DSM 8605]
MKFMREYLLKYKAYIVILLIIILFLIAGYEYYEKYFYVLKDPERIKEYVMSFGKFGYLVFLMMQIIQVIAFFIPGEIIQIASGYIYGTFLGTITSVVGITIGSIIVYGIAYRFGRPFVEKIVSERDLKLFHRILEIGSMKYIIFLVYLIPGLPKDVLAYFCGISDLKFKDFAIYSTLGRIPGIAISSYFGANLISGNNVTLIIIAITMSIIFILGVIKGERIIKSIVH